MIEIKIEEIMSKDYEIAAKAIDTAIKEQIGKESYSSAQTANRYYESDHDIKNNRIFYLDDNGVLKEDKYATNVQIPHSFFTELVDQKVNYLMSNPVRFEVKENDELQRLIDEYVDEDFQLFVSELLEDVSISGATYAYMRTNADDKLCFQVSRFLKTFMVYDETYDEVAVIRYYKKQMQVENKLLDVMFAERWTDENVTYFKTDRNGKLIFDKDRPKNPKPHVVAKADNGTYLTRTYGRIPFYKLSNNHSEKSDLASIKALIDDYDLMACFLSNNLMDYDKPIYVVSGFRGTNLSELRQNIKARGIVNVGNPDNKGNVDLKTFNIPFEARKAKLEIDKEAIYKFGMGFDNSQTGDGNVTNVVIKSRYTLLEMKCRKVEIRLRSLLKWALHAIVDDINRLNQTNYSTEGIQILIEPEMIVNESDIANIDKLEAETKQTLISAIVSSAPYLGEDTVIDLICKQWDLDVEEVRKAIEADSEVGDNDESVGTGTTEPGEDSRPENE